MGVSYVEGGATSIGASQPKSQASSVWPHHFPHTHCQVSRNSQVQIAVISAGKGMQITLFNVFLYFLKSQVVSFTRTFKFSFLSIFGCVFKAMLLKPLLILKNSKAVEKFYISAWFFFPTLTKLSSNL